MAARSGDPNPSRCAHGRGSGAPDGDCVGPAVNRVARLRGVANGGEIIVSAATAAIVRAALPAGCELVDIGAVELRGLDHPEPAFVLAAPDLDPVERAGISPREAEVLAPVGEHRSNAEIGARLFISVRTVETHVSSLLRKLGVLDRRALALVAGELARARRSSEALASLPSPLTSFIGRTQERAALAGAVRANRLVTAVGAGGVGKTRLALGCREGCHDRVRRRHVVRRPGPGQRSGGRGQL